MVFERLSLLADGGTENGGYVTLWISFIAVALLVFVLIKAFKPKRAAGEEGTTAESAKKWTITAEEVVLTRFRPTKFKEGYDQDQVDDLLDRVVQELRRLQEENESLGLTRANPRRGPVSVGDPIITPEQLTSQKFTATRLREGYSQADVDDFLAKVVAGLRERIAENKRLKGQFAGNGHS